jgi:hypothetical protein
MDKPSCFCKIDIGTKCNCETKDQHQEDIPFIIIQTIECDYMGVETKTHLGIANGDTFPNDIIELICDIIIGLVSIDDYFHDDNRIQYNHFRSICLYKFIDKVYYFEYGQWKEFDPEKFNKEICELFYKKNNKYPIQCEDEDDDNEENKDDEKET